MPAGQDSGAPTRADDALGALAAPRARAALDALATTEALTASVVDDAVGDVTPAVPRSSSQPASAKPTTATQTAIGVSPSQPTCAAAPPVAPGRPAPRPHQPLPDNRRAVNERSDDPERDMPSERMTGRGQRVVDWAGGRLDGKPSRSPLGLLTAQSACAPGCARPRRGATRSRSLSRRYLLNSTQWHPRFIWPG